MLSLFRSRRCGLRLCSQSPVGFYGAAMAPDLKNPASGDLIVLAGGEQLWRIGWPGAPVLVVTKNGPDGNALYRLADPRFKTSGPPKSVSMACWRGLTALALVGGNGSPPCPKSLTQQLISLIPAI